MKIKPYVDKLQKSKEYSSFLAEYPQAFMIAGFFVIDMEEGKNVHQIDFYVPSAKKIAAFTLDGAVNMQMLDTMNNKIPEHLDLKTNIDLDALPGIIKDEMRNRSMTEDIKKMIAVIQNIDGKKIWNVNCVLSGMEILKSHIEDESETVLKIEKTSMSELIRKLPMQPPSAASAIGKGKKSVKDELKKLEEIQAAISKEKEQLQAALVEKPSKKKPKKK